MPTAIYGKVTGPWADHVDRHAAEQCAVGLERVAPIMIFARKRMRGRVLENLTTTFASRYKKRVDLEEMLTKEAVTDYRAMKTGEKYLVMPWK